MIAQESAGNPHAVSRAGAKGLMQLMDGTARDMGARNVFDPRDNVLSGTRYMRQLLDRFDGNVQLALAGYNAGPSAVERHKGIPPYSETQNYVQRVLGLQKQFLPRDAASQGAGQ
jgi:soluble lytic murein transglycosylase-like protein